MSLFFAQRNHLIRRGFDAAGTFFSNLVPCHSHTCSRGECQARAVARLEKALRFSLRSQYVVMLTWTKLPDSDAARAFHDAMLKVLRKSGFEAEAFSVVEHHTQGLVHVHTILKGTATRSEIRAAFESVRPSLPQTRWSTFDADGHADAEDAGYSLKNYAHGNRSRHLLLNGGKLYLAASRGFFHVHGVTGIDGCWRAEKARGQAFHDLVNLVGLGTAWAEAERAADAKAIRYLIATLKRGRRAARLRELESEPWFQDFATSLNEVTGFKVPFCPLRS